MIMVRKFAVNSKLQNYILKARRLSKVILYQISCRYWIFVTHY